MIPSDKKTNVFLDLEGTIIDTWGSNETLQRHVEPIKLFLQMSKVTQIQIFSFAIYNVQDQDQFIDRLKGGLEKTLGVEIIKWPNMIQMMSVDMRVRSTRLDDIHEFVLLRGKEGAFESWATRHHAGETSILIDDVVANRHLVDRDTDTTIWFTNVKTLADQFHNTANIMLHTEKGTC